MAQPRSRAPPGGTGATAAIPFPLPSIAIGTHGIGRYDVSWHWQMQLTASGPWVTFDCSDHTVYVTIDLSRRTLGRSRRRGPPIRVAVDGSPRSGVRLGAWRQDHTSTAEVAAATAARRIEQGIFDLGTRASVPLEYYGLTQDTPSDSGVGVFFLTDFLSLLNGNPPADRSGIDCTDCAAAVATFANAMGCGLTLHRIRRAAGFGFDTNPVAKRGGRADARVLRSA